MSHSGFTWSGEKSTAGGFVGLPGGLQFLRPVIYSDLQMRGFRAVQGNFIQFVVHSVFMQFLGQLMDGN